MKKLLLTNSAAEIDTPMEMSHGNNNNKSITQKSLYEQNAVFEK